MIRIAISEAAFKAIAATMLLGSVGYEAEPNTKGERMIWLDARVVDKLTAMRRPAESYSDVILRLVESEAGNHAPMTFGLASSRRWIARSITFSKRHGHCNGQSEPR